MVIATTLMVTMAILMVIMAILIVIMAILIVIMTASGTSGLQGCPSHGHTLLSVGD